MPDDIQVAEHEAGAVDDKDFGSGFDDEAGATAVTPSADPEVADPVVPDDEKPADEKKEEAPVVTDEEKALSDRAKEFEKTPEPAPAPAAKPVEPPAAPVAAPTETLKLSDVMSIPGLDKVGIEVDGKTTPLGDFVKEYPEVAQASAAIAKAMVKQAMDALTGGMVKPEHIAKVEQEMANNRFWNDLSDELPEARKISKSTEFKEWIGKQSNGVKAMCSSLDVNDALTVLKAFRSATAKAAKDAAGSTQANKKDAKDGLHKDTLRAKKDVPKTDSGKAEDDFDAGFNS